MLIDIKLSHSFVTYKVDVIVYLRMCIVIDLNARTFSEFAVSLCLALNFSAEIKP